jgi:hypothetical protein
MELTQAEKFLELKARERQLWDVVLLPKLTVPVGAPLYIVWSEEHKAGKTKPHPFQGDVRIVRKERTEKKNTIFVFKDGCTYTCLTTQVKSMVVTSNALLSSAQSAIILAKKMAHAEVPEIHESDDEEDNDDKEDDKEDSEDDDEEDDEDDDYEEGKTEEESVVNRTTVPAAGTQLPDTTLVPEAGTQLPDTTPVAAAGTQLPDTTPVAAAGTQLPETTPVPAAGTQLPDTTSVPAAGTQLPDTTPVPAAATANSPPTTSLANPFAFSNTTSQPHHGYDDLPPAPSADPNVIANAARELRDAQEKVKAAKKLMLHWKKEATEKSQVRAEKKRLEARLKAVKLEVKKEAAATKLQAQHERTKRQRSDESDIDVDSDSDDERPKKRVLSTIDKWQKGHRRAAISAAKNKIVEKVTVHSWAEAKDMMEKYGFAVVENWTELMSAESQPTAEQRDYILHRKTLFCYTHVVSSNRRYAIFFGPYSSRRLQRDHLRRGCMWRLLLVLQCPLR